MHVPARDPHLHVSALIAVLISNWKAVSNLLILSAPAYKQIFQGYPDPSDKIFGLSTSPHDVH